MKYGIAGPWKLTLRDIWEILISRPADLAFAIGLLLLAALLFWVLRYLSARRVVMLSRPTLPGLLITAYMVIIPLPSIIWFCESDHPVRYTYLIAAYAVPILMLLGVAGANTLFNDPARTIRQFLFRKLVKTRADVYFSGFYRAVVVGSIFVVGAFFLGEEYIPLIGGIRDYGGKSGDEVRLSIYDASDIMKYAYALTVRLFLPFCVLYGYFRAHLYKGLWKYRFWLAFGMALIVSSLSLERSPTLGLFLVLALAFYFKHNLSFSKRHILLFLGALFVGAVIHRIQYQMSFEPWDIAEDMAGLLIGRIWLDPSYMAMFAFQEYNYSIGFLHGRSIRLIAPIVGGYESFSSLGFMGDLWANFGWPGIILGSLLLGFILEFIQLTFFKVKSIPTLVVYILLLANSLWLVYGSIVSTMVLSVYIGGLLMLVIGPRVEWKVSGAAKPSGALLLQRIREINHQPPSHTGRGIRRQMRTRE